MQNSAFSTWITCLRGSQTSLEVFAWKTATLGPDLQVCMCPRPNVRYWALITACLEQEYQVYMGYSLHLWFLYAKQWPMGPRPLLWFCACKIGWLSPKLLVSKSSSAHLWFFACKTGTLGLELQASVGPRNDLSFCGSTTACLASETLVSMGPSHHLWLLHAKRRVLYPNNECQWVPDLTCHFVHSKQRN